MDVPELLLLLEKRKIRLDYAGLERRRMIADYLYLRRRWGIPRIRAAIIAARRGWLKGKARKVREARQIRQPGVK